MRGGGYRRFEVRLGDMWFVWMLMHGGVGKMRPFSFQCSVYLEYLNSCGETQMLKLL